ncbi:MAG: glutamate formimidoyltransferase [Sphingobacteriales bacterium]|nr:MAG: glutamate formimidoyltransferase [Sphingobacteriales bacterium]
MISKQKILECVPNFSEGRDAVKIEAIADAIRSVYGAHLLHIDISPAANRTVMTFAGEPEPVIEAAFRAIKKAGEVIDMRTQEGVHPRIGATDVCPLVPLANMTMDEAIACAGILGSRVGKELNIPVYLYEHSASKLHRRALPDIRKGQYEGFEAKISHPDWLPDYGPAVFTPATGATVIGARDILVAFNISLTTQEVSKANYIADRIRERGYFKTEDGKKVRVPGLLPKLRAIGWYMADYETAQVSMNLIDYRITSPLTVWNTCKAVAAEASTDLVGSEVIGLIPESCLIETGTYVYLKEMQKVPDDKEILIQKAITYLGLDKVKPFEAQAKILEHALEHAGLI